MTKLVRLAPIVFSVGLMGIPSGCSADVEFGATGAPRDVGTTGRLVAAQVAQDLGKTVKFGAAGVPQNLGKTRDYDKIFTKLKAGGFEIFFPTFQTVEAPKPKTLGFEVDFLAPCTPSSPAFAALRRHGIRLLFPGGLLYPADGAMPPLSDDPLAALIRCAGRNGIYGILGHDEPAHRQLNVKASKDLYERVKRIDPTIPVLMVHAAIILDQPKHKSASGRSAYLNSVRAHSRYADVVGFDVYPIPKVIAWVGTPESNGQTVDHGSAITSYMRWLKRNLPDKKRFMVLQGFSYADQYSPELLRQIGKDILAIVRPPKADEMNDMVGRSVTEGASAVIWWGQSQLKDEQTAPWPHILSVIKATRGN